MPAEFCPEAMNRRLALVSSEALPLLECDLSHPVDPQYVGMMPKLLEAAPRNQTTQCVTPFVQSNQREIALVEGGKDARLALIVIPLNVIDAPCGVGY